MIIPSVKITPRSQHDTIRHTHSSVTLVAGRAVVQLSNEGGDVRDGAALVATMKTITFAGVSGFVQLNADGDRYNDGEVQH